MQITGCALRRSACYTQDPGFAQFHSYLKDGQKDNFLHSFSEFRYCTILSVADKPKQDEPISVP